MKKYACMSIQMAAVLAAFAVSAGAAETESAVAVVAEKGVPGGAVVATRGMTVTIEKIEAETRKVTLALPGGKSTVYTAGPAVANFAQMKVGDKVRVTELEAIVVTLQKGGEPAKDSAASGLALAPLGDKPGMLVGDAVEIQATIKALDTTARTATLELTDGTTRTVKVRDDVDMAKGAVGDKVSIKLVEALAVTVHAP